MIYFVKAYVAYKDSVLDSQGGAVEKVVRRMGYEIIEDIRIGKHFEIQLADIGGLIDTVTETICDKLLVNVNMETYRHEIKKMEEV